MPIQLLLETRLPIISHDLTAWVMADDGQLGQGELCYFFAGPAVAAA